tara:strand:+ start:175 stop:1614 length:1440 start_codon:yes stop_codon:yes gene_type:complete
VAKTATEERIKRLKDHLEIENPALAEVVTRFQDLDQVARKLGFMGRDDSYATQISWWPVVAILGTYSAGKSTFLNEYLGQSLQRTGNQAVDDKFTVIAYGSDDAAHHLPGLALDKDPRFPFYQISSDIERVAEGEGKRIDAYLQLRTTNAPVLQGKIFIDSPGFDADQQRSSTLMITDHIIDLSDLVLVFFDARHPEPGAMADTLKHLVVNTAQRADSAKFLYILNQMDNTAREDNPEEVVAAWQRALAESGLTAGRFFRIYSENAAQPIADDKTRERYQTKRDEDLNDIKARINQLDVERAYRIIGSLEGNAKHLRDTLIPKLIDVRQTWSSRSMWLNGIVLGGGLAAFLYYSVRAGAWHGLYFTPFSDLGVPFQIVVAIIGTALLIYINSMLRRLAGLSVLQKLRRHSTSKDDNLVINAFEANMNSWWSSLTPSTPLGWTARNRRKLEAIIAGTGELVQKLNDRFARPISRKPNAEE